MNAAGVARLQREHLRRTYTSPHRKTIVTHKVGRADGDGRRLKYTLVPASPGILAGPHRSARRLCHQFADDGLLTRGLNRVGARTCIQKLCDPIYRSAFEMSHEAERSVRPDEKRRIGDG